MSEQSSSSVLLPVGQSIATPIELMCPTSEPPVHVSGVMTMFGGSDLELQFNQEVEHVADGARAVVTVTGDSGMRILGVVTSSDGRTMKLDVVRVVRKDKRDYPRMFGGIELRYRVVPAEEMQLAERAWMNGLSGVDSTPWRQPDPFMNFSGSGIRFRDEPHCTDGDLILLELQVPTSNERFRASAVVVRVEAIEIPTDKSLPDARTHFIAVQFRNLRSNAIEALTRFTLDLQLQAMAPGD